MRSRETNSSYVYVLLGKSVLCLGAGFRCACALLASVPLLTWWLLLSWSDGWSVVVVLWLCP